MRMTATIKWNLEGSVFPCDGVVGTNIRRFPLIQIGERNVLGHRDRLHDHIVVERWVEDSLRCAKGPPSQDCISTLTPQQPRSYSFWMLLVA